MENLSSVESIFQIFRQNILKANVIWSLKKEHIEKDFGETAKDLLAELDNAAGVENIAKSQSLVMMVTSFEAFCKDLFKKVILNDPSLLKKF